MTPDELTNAVEAAIARQMMRTVPHTPGDRMYLHVARAALRVALEEAAKVAEEYGEFDRKMIVDAEDEEERAAFQRGAFKASNIAAAIRAMIPKD